MSEYSRSITITVSPDEVQRLRNVLDDALFPVRVGGAKNQHDVDVLDANAVVNRMERAVARLLWEEDADDYDWPVREFSCDEINER